MGLIDKELGEAHLHFALSGMACYPKRENEIDQVLHHIRSAHMFWTPTMEEFVVEMVTRMNHKPSRRKQYSVDLVFSALREKFPDAL